MQAPRGGDWRPLTLPGVQEDMAGHKGLSVRKALSELESSVQILVITRLGAKQR